MPGDRNAGARSPSPDAAGAGLAPGVVRVWLVDPDACSPAAIAACEAVLDAGERLRAERLRTAAARRSFVVAHALARRSLSRCAPVAPTAWRFAAARPGGRPEVEAPAGGAGLRFNLSHTDGLAACAVARVADVGVDVEAGARLHRPLALAERFFAPEEAAALRALPEALQREQFVALWAAKEAVLKARGVGLAAGLAAVRIALDAGGPRLVASGARDDAGAAWQLSVLRPTPAHALAVAVRRAAGPALRVEVAFEDGRAGAAGATAT
jgi:4'-phosphopantetheinyl transferase